MDCKKKHTKKAAAHLDAAASDAGHAAEKASAAADHAIAAVNAAAAALVAALGQAQEKAGPTAKQAWAKAAEATEHARTQVEPHLNTAYGFVQPGVESARQKVSDDLLPRLQDMLHEAEEHPAVAEATKRGAAALAALKGDVVVAEEPEVPAKRRVGKTVTKLVAASALLAGAAVAVRQFLLSKDDGWTAHEPSPAYTPEQHTPDSKLVYTTQTTVDDKTEEMPVTEQDADTAAAEDVPATADDVVTEGDPVAEMAGEGGVAPETAAPAPAVDAAEGDGSYVGEEPPAGFNIKGNERSKKYHTTDSAGYERTIADVWFNSEEAAKAAGFTKAQR